MIITPHLLLGAAIGAKAKHFGWIVILGIIGHFLLDKIPHWDYGQKKLVFKTFIEMTIDGLIGLIIVLFIIWQKDMVKTEYLIFILVGISASLLPDFFLGITKLTFNKSKFSKKYIDFHEKILHCPKHIFKPTPLGVGTEILVSLIIILVLLL